MLAGSRTDFDFSSADAHEQTAWRYFEPPFQTVPQNEIAETDHRRFAQMWPAVLG